MYTLSAQKPVPMRNFSGGGATEEGGQVILRALEPKSGKRVWEYPMTGVGRMWAGTVSNAGGVVFSGDDDGNVIALDAKNGKHVWNFNVGENLGASPIIYELDGKQYFAIASATAVFNFGLFEPVKPVSLPKIAPSR
jgi:alcohol dehydrogenase (cytochrome c)